MGGHKSRIRALAFIRKPYLGFCCSAMDKAWVNQTSSPRPKSHPAVVWAEEVIRASGKSLFVSAVACCCFGPSHGGPTAAIVVVSLLIFFFASSMCDYMPVFGEPSAEKPYHTFKAFWPRYLAEHREPRDRVVHVFEFFGVATFM